MSSGSLWPGIRRWCTHLWMDEASVRQVLPADARQRLEEQVRQSETRHRGELRICVEGGLGWHDLRRGLSARDRAIELFSQLRVWDTAHNNGVLIYLLLADRQIEILADRGIAEQVDPQVWHNMVQGLSQHFKTGNHDAGLMQAIELVGQCMRTHYPVCDRHPDNPNELPDAIVIL